MTFSEALERLRNQDEYLKNHPDNITLPLAEQIEANRIAIEELRREQAAHLPPWSELVRQWMGPNNGDH